MIGGPRLAVCREGSWPRTPRDRLAVASLARHTLALAPGGGVRLEVVR